MTVNLIARFEKRFRTGTTVRVDLEHMLNPRSVTALIGPSGCGKTTLLRCLSGLTSPDQGTISFGNDLWFDFDRKVSLAPQQRDVGFLFQQYALFPHLNVADNLGFGLGHLSSVDRQSRVRELLERFGLSDIAQQFPTTLSGGQQQRVALARALARRPRLLLLDEPLSALDALLRERMRSELQKTLREIETPVILVTHDRLEAISLADHVAVMDQGMIQQVGPVQEVFMRPRNASLARLVGVETIVSGEILHSAEGLATVQVGTVQLLAVEPSIPSRLVDVCIKGEDVALRSGPSGSTSIRNQIDASVVSLTREGPLIRVELDCGFGLTALITRPACDELQLRIGSTVTAMVKAPAIHLIPRAGAV